MTIDHAPTVDQDADPRRLEEFLGRFAEDQAAAMHTATIVLGEQLGLFRALADGGPQTSAQLAARARCEPRLVAEWLRAQAVSGYCEHDPDTATFWLDAAQEACLADEGGPTYLAGGLATASAVHRSIDQVAAAFRGEGSLPWAAHDPALFTGVATAFQPAYETHLTTSWIAALEGVERRLEAGGRIADIGCGFGTSTVLLARRFPAASVAGFDGHELSIDEAQRRAASAGVSDRVTFQVADATRFPGHDYDLVCVLNALHEMGDPVGACRRIRAALAEHGRAMLVEPIAGASLEEDRTPVGRSFSSASTMICLPSALSQGGTWHLGARAPDEEFAEVATAAGFRRCHRVAETTLHRVLELAP